MSVVVILSALAALTGSPSTDLAITVWPAGRGKASHRWTLRCGPPGGTLPRPARACVSLSRQDNPFRSVPRNTACTEIYGGPQDALVTGRYRGRRVWARFARHDGCQIARWDRLRRLFV